MSESSQAYVIEVQGLSKVFDQVHAVDGISFRVRQGVTTALLGGNGTTAVVTNGASVAVLDGTGSPITGATAVVAGGVLTVQLPAA